jgi:hypothetical protein
MRPPLAPAALARFAALALLAGGCASEPVELGLDLEPGRSFAVVLSATQDLVQELDDGESVSSQTVTLRWHEHVEAVDALGNATMVHTYDSVQFLAEAPDGRIEYDSNRDGPDAPAGAFGLGAVVGESLRIELGPRGRVRAIHGVRELVDRVVGRLALPPGVDAASVRQGLERHFGEDAVRDRLSTLFGVLPDGPVRVGDTWTRTSEVRAPFPHRRVDEYELDEVDGESATVFVKSRIRPLEDAPPVRSGTAELRFRVEGRQEGRLVIDRATGILSLGEILQDLEGTMTLSSPGRDDLTIPLELIGKIELATTDR